MTDPKIRARSTAAIFSETNNTLSNNSESTGGVAAKFYLSAYTVANFRNEFQANFLIFFRSSFAGDFSVLLQNIRTVFYDIYR
jgi:hypothetical protein